MLCMNEIDLAYLAGVVDSDGSITIGAENARRIASNKSPRFFEIITVRQCDKEAVYLAQELFGGNITIGKPGSLSGRPSYDWYLYNRKACAAIRTLLPYLRIKRRQAEIVLALREVKDRGRTANTALEDVGIPVNGRYGNTRPLRRRYLRPEVLAEYKALTIQVRSLNDTRLADPFADRDAVVEIAG